jgi:hypothetical protein
MGRSLRSDDYILAREAALPPFHTGTCLEHDKMSRCHMFCCREECLLEHTRFAMSEYDAVCGNRQLQAVFVASDAFY